MMRRPTRNSMPISWRPIRLVGLLLAILPYGMSISAVVAPLMTQSEISENRSSERERGEELTVDSRSHHVRQLLVEHTHRGEGRVFPVALRIDTRQTDFLADLVGHRLSHELLAPMTC